MVGSFAQTIDKGMFHTINNEPFATTSLFHSCFFTLRFWNDPPWIVLRNCILSVEACIDFHRGQTH